MLGKKPRVHRRSEGSLSAENQAGVASSSGCTGRKTVLCLDTNYLSNLAKARGVGHLPDEVASLWQELSSVLEDAVWSDLLICPGFDIQIKEAEFDDRLALPVWTMMRALSLGVQFLSHDDIVAGQVEDAAYRFLGQEPPVRLPWERVFQHDPDVPAVELSRRVRARPFAPPFHSPDVIARRRAKKNENAFATRHESGPLTGSAFQSRMDAERRALVSRWFSRDVLLEMVDSLRADRPPQDIAKWRTTLQSVDLLGRLRQAGMTAGRTVEFVNSTQLKSIQYVDVYCSVAVAADVSVGDARTPRSGDEFDRRIVSAMMPSCDMLCTDRFIKHVLVDLLHFDVKYGCRVFSGTVEDVQSFMGAVQSLPSVSSGESVK